MLAACVQWTRDQILRYTFLFQLNLFNLWVLGYINIHIHFVAHAEQLFLLFMGMLITVYIDGS